MTLVDMVVRSAEQGAAQNPPLIGSLAEALTSKYSMEIMLATLGRPRSVREISGERKIPLSSCHRRIKRLVEEGLMVVHQIHITDDGKKIALYRCVFEDLTLELNREGVTVRAHANEEAVAKLRKRGPDYGY